MTKKTRFSRKGAKLSEGVSNSSTTPTMGGRTDWYATGGDKEFTMNIRNPEDVGIARPEKNVDYACKVGFCAVDKNTGKPIVKKTANGKSGASKWVRRNA